MLSNQVFDEVSEYLSGPVTSVERLSGGANNQVFSFISSGSKYVLKNYFHNKGAIRNRGETEFSFSSQLWSIGERAIPKPIEFNTRSNWALYEKVSGVPIVEPTRELVLQAADFISRIKYQHEGRFQEASEACIKSKLFSEILNHRLDRLLNIPLKSETAKKARAFVENVLVPNTERYVSSSVINDSTFAILSPSDFGYHNALIGDDGRMIFLDFEHAGMDDPVKMICDFFSQPRVKVPMTYFDDFLARAFSDAEAEEVYARTRSIMPFVRLKWCCILLNEFLIDGAERRGFAFHEGINEECQKKQLQKSISMFESIQHYGESF